MSWQEELRKLDEELASGRLSADDYRVRRDQVLSSAVGQAEPQQQLPQQNQPTEGNPDSTQIIAPVSPPQGTPAQPPASSDPERTQAVSQQWQQQPPPQGDGRTEYVAPPTQHQVPYSPPGGFPQAGPVSPAGGFPQAGPASPAGGFPQAPWNAADPDQSPPWGGGDLPPLSPSGDAGWSQQGPESFAAKPKKGNGAKIGAIIAAVVVLAGVAIGAYLLWGQSSGSGDGGQAATSQAPPPPAPPAGPLVVADLPGTAENFDRIKNFSQIPDLQYLTSAEVSAYQGAQAGDTKFVGRKLPDGSRVLLLLTQVSDPQAASSLANDLLQIQIHNGMSRMNDAPDGVLASSIDSKSGNPAQVRGHYSHNDVVVRIEVNNPDAQTAKADFTQIVNAELKALPANG